MEEQGNFVQFSPEAFLEEAIGIIQKAQDKRICLRILGALAVYIHCERCPQYRDFFFTLGRLGEGKPIFTDLDVMGYSRLRRASSWRERPVSAGPLRQLAALERHLAEHLPPRGGIRCGRLLRPAQLQPPRGVR